MEQIISDSLYEKKILKTKRFINNMLHIRWVFILFIIPLFYLSTTNHVLKETFIEILGAISLYNLFVTFFVASRGENKRFLPNVFFYIDIIIISTLSVILGGIKSDIYIILFFIICYYGINNDISYTVNISIFTISIYSISSIFIEYRNLYRFNYWNLIIRDLFIIITAFGISVIIAEVKKYHEMHKKEFKLARTDKLTGLPNRHYLEQKINEEVLYADYYGKPLNVLIFDLDNFKKFNDSYGHIQGDKLLALFAEIIMQNVRKYDVPIRYGGEEFLILVRDLELDMAKRIGDRIRTQLEKQHLYIEDNEIRRKVTVSCGIAQYPANSTDIREVIELADKALYQAKENGKNVVIGYEAIKEVICK